VKESVEEVSAAGRDAALGEGSAAVNAKVRVCLLEAGPAARFGVQTGIMSEHGAGAVNPKVAAFVRKAV